MIVVNDNQQSISETHGGIYKNFAALREFKGATFNNMFTAIGLDCIYVENGNDIESLIAAFRKVKDNDHPIAVHINTQKGKGYELAETNKEQWRWTIPFDRKTGKPLRTFSIESYGEIAKSPIFAEDKKNEGVIVISPKRPGAFALSKADRDALPNSPSTSTSRKKRRLRWLLVLPSVAFTQSL